VTATIYQLGKPMAKTKPAPTRNLAHLNRDRGYRFTDRDPVLILVTRVITDSGMALKAIENKCGVTAHTMRQWQSGKTKRPQNATVDMVLRTLGYTRQVIAPDGKVLTYG